MNLIIEKPNLLPKENDHKFIRTSFFIPLNILTHLKKISKKEMIPVSVLVRNAIVKTYGNGLEEN